ncbi:MAG: hypothetical protein K8H88_17420 [Sandaracinaceae bacterium]|nr:hypothetical protein [Sandaracinaceae bacterium]
MRTDPSTLPPTTLQRLVAMFGQAMKELGQSPSDTELEQWSVLIHASMSGRGRSYHTVDHIFDVYDEHGPPDAIGTLAILFHDTVYFEVDGGLPRGLELYLSDALEVEHDRVELGPFDPEHDALRALVARIFGFEPGQAVTLQSGLNELASALLAVRALCTHLTLGELAQVITCIEATRPFRPVGAEEDLAARLAQADQEHDLGLGEEGVARAVVRAVGISNRDVANFAYEDTGLFLSYTWEIIPETSPTLRLPAYTLGEYRVAMTKMSGFFAGLTPERVFREFRGQPSGVSLSKLRAQASINLERGTRYLREKLLAARLLESLALMTGGDAPVSLLMGDLPASDKPVTRLEDLLPEMPAPVKDADPEVLRLLVEGRQRDSGFDLKTSPLAAYLYAHMGAAATDAALASDEGAPFLTAIPREALAEVVQACMRIAPTRAKALEGVLSRLPS